MSETGFCPDCNHDRSAGADMVSFTPDPGWVAECSAPLAGGEEPSGGMGVLISPDGTRWDTWTEPVIGWAVIEHHYEGMFDSGHERRMEPVLLAEGEFVETLREYLANRKEGIHTRIIRSGPAARSTRPRAAPWQA
jgi:hypothetical protein